MSSIITNRAAMTALQTLRSITDSVNETEKHISTGLRISEASDNLAYWGITNSLKTDSVVMGTVKDSLNVGLSAINQAYDANTQVKKELQAITQSLANAQGSKLDGKAMDELRKQIKIHLKNIKSAALNGSINGQNLLVSNGEVIDTEEDTNKPSNLQPGPDKVSFVASFRRYNGAIITDTIDIALKEVRLFSEDELKDRLTGEQDPKKAMIDAGTALHKGYAPGILHGLYDGKQNAFALDDKAWDDLVKTYGTIYKKGTTVVDKPGHVGLNEKGMHDLVANVMKLVNDFSEKVNGIDVILGSAKQEIKSQVEFVNSLRDNLSKSIGSLVDADMDAESARLSALQVQQQLAVQSLSLANQSSQHILQLFRS